MHSGLFILAALHCAVFCMAREESCTVDEVGGCASSGHSITNGKEATQSTFLRGGHARLRPFTRAHRALLRSCGATYVRVRRYSNAQQSVPV